MRILKYTHRKCMLLFVPVVLFWLLALYVTLQHQQPDISYLEHEKKHHRLVVTRDQNARNHGKHKMKEDEYNRLNANISLRKTETTYDNHKQKQQKELHQSSKCQHWFEPTFEENLRVISNYPRGKVDDYMTKVGENVTHPEQMMTQFPVLVTAADSGYYGVSQGLLKSIHEKLIPKYRDVKILYYDLGLTETQNKQLRKYCKCEVRKFPFDEFPKHVRQLKTYTWKPIIVKTVLLEYGWVWWMDSSVRFVSNDLDQPLQYSLNNSVLFFTYAVVLSVAQHADKRTMAFLGEDVCKFRHFGEIEATFTLYHFDHVSNTLVNQWVACAVNSDCMAPIGAKLSCSIGNKSDGQCHRFDQTVLSIMLRRLYHDKNDYPLVEKQFRIHVIIRGEEILYFPKR